MVKLLKKKYNFLSDLSHLSKRDREKYLNSCCEENIHTVCEAVDNVLKNVCVGKKKRKLLTNSQTGAGVFSIIASTVLPFLAELLAKRS